MRTRVRDFSLKHTLESGQFFRYELSDNWYYVTTRNEFFKVRQANSILEYEGVKKEFIRNFFVLNEDIDKVTGKLCKDKLIRKCLLKYKGLRIMRQDPWECLISFMCSAASNIKRIQKNVKSIAENFGNKIFLENKQSYSFPDTGEIRYEKLIKKCHLGFRAKKILETNRIIAKQGIDYDGTYRDVNTELSKLPGVGEKIADCVQLFSMNFPQAFPVDVWIRRIMQQHYLKAKSSNNKIKQFAWKRFGNNAGYAQQYLYHWVRNDGKGD